MSVDLAALREQHLDHHGPSRLCMWPSVCSAVGYLAIIEQVLGERDTARDLAISLENLVARLKDQRHIVAGHEGPLEACLYEICLHDLDVKPESWL